MWNSLQTPKSEDIEDLLDQSPTGETPDSGALPRALARQESDESDDDDADYIPPGLASFVKQIDATLNSTKEGFLTTAAKSPTREPAVFCFDGGGGRPATPPMEDEEDVGFKNQVLEKFKPKPGDQRFDVAEILATYGDNTPNDAEEGLFSPDLQTPPPNPHYEITGTEARRLALGSPDLTVDTDVLPIRPPAHEDDSGSSSQMDEPDEPMDPMSWLDSSLCDRQTDRCIAEKGQGTSSKKAPRAAPDPAAALFQGMSFEFTSPVPQSVPPPAAAPPPVAAPIEASHQHIFPVHEIRHVGDIDETNLEPPPSSPEHARTSVAKVEAPTPPLEIEVKSKEKKPTDSVPREVAVQPKKISAPEQIVPREVTVEKTLKPPVTDIEIKPKTPRQSQKTPTQTPSKRPRPSSATRTDSTRKGGQSVFDRLSRPTTASATKAMSAKGLAQPSSRTPSTRTPPTRSTPVPMSSGSKNSDTKRSNASVQRPKLPARTSLSNVTPTTNRTSPALSGDNTSRKSTSKSKTHESAGLKPSPTSTSTRTTPPAARVTKTFKQTQASPAASVTGGQSRAQGTSPVLSINRDSKPAGVSSRLLEETTASKQRHAAVGTEHTTDHVPKQPTTDSVVSSRLMQETVASRQHHAAAEVEFHDNASRPRSRSRDVPVPNVPSRLLQDTVSSRLHHSSDGQEEEPASGNTGHSEPHLPSRLLQETTASRQRHTAMEEELHSQTTSQKPHGNGSKSAVSSRLLQETTAFKQRLAAKVENINCTPPKTVKTDDSKLLASREKAQERIRQRIAKEKEKERASKPRSRSTKVSAEEGIARAKERVRQRQLKEQQERLAQGKENSGRRATTQRFERPSSTGTKEKQRRPLTIPEPPSFSVSKRQAVGRTPVASTTSPAESDNRVDHAPVFGITWAQSTDILRKGLRCDDVSHSSTTSAHRELTVPHAPRFATSARNGEKLPSASWKEAPTLASSTRLLQNQLRGGDPSLMKKREFKLTVPEPPKFHKTAKRALPKSTAEIEEEMMKKLNAQPFKARPYRPHVPRPATADRKPRAHASTTPSPFHLASDSRAATAAASSLKEGAAQTESQDDVELKKKFHARPMPSFAKPPQIKKAPRAIPNADPSRSISPPKLRTSDRAGKRQETAQSFSSHAEQVQRQKELENKRRHREKHEEGIRKAEAQRAATTPRAPETPFQLMSQARHENYQKKREEQLRREEEAQKKASSFHARQFRPAPAPEEKRERAPATTPEPFHLRSLQRHSAYEERTRRMFLEAEEEAHEKAHFRARPVPQTTYKDSSSPSGQPFLLATTARLHAYQEQKKKREEAELEELRRQSQFKARPVPPTTYEYLPPSSPQRSPNSFPGRQGFQNNGHRHAPGSSPERQGLRSGPHIETGGTENIVLDEPPRATPPARPPVSAIVFQS